MAAPFQEARPAKTEPFSPRFGDWQLGDELHRRGCAAVYDARSRHASAARAQYVIKLLDASAVSLQRIARFTAEAEAARRIRSPHVVAALAVHCHAEPYYFVMPKIAGRTLSDLLAEAGRLSVATALHVARQAAAGLQAMHEAGLLHADLRPGNILVGVDGHVTLLDLEHSHPVGDEADPVERCILGTVEYLAPEALTSRSRADCRSDLYSLGICLFQMLTGRLPLEGPTPDAVLVAHLSQEPPPLREFVASLPNDVCEFVRRLLHKQPLRRPQSAAEAVDTLARLEIAHLEMRAA